MEVQATTDTSALNERTTSTGDAFSDLGMDEFIQLMITELQNQDPLNPMDNAQMLEQIGQIREISSNDKLSNTLESLMLSQGISMASGLIGQKVSALSDENKRIEGMVDRVLIDGSEAKLIVTEKVPEATDPETGETIAEHTVEHRVSVKNVGEIFNINVEDTAEPAEQTDLPAMLSAARELIGQSVLGLSQSGKAVAGDVRRVDMENGTPMLILTQNIPAELNPTTQEETSPAKTVDHRVPLANISTILSEHVETSVVNVAEAN